MTEYMRDLRQRRKEMEDYVAVDMRTLRITTRETRYTSRIAKSKLDETLSFLRKARIADIHNKEEAFKLLQGGEHTKREIGKIKKFLKIKYR